MVKAIVGANWGDEGKGKITDVLADKSDIVIRFQGGANAGHTIINDFGKFALHQLPSGVFHQNIVNIIGNGVAFSVENFVKEMKELEDRGVPKPNIIISDRAQIVMPYHVAFDCYEEERLGKNSFGSTKSGIAPFYSDKYSKIGFQINELYDDPDSLKEKIHHALEIKNATLQNLYNKPAITEQEVYDKLMEYKDQLAEYVGDAFMFIHNALKEGKNILLEGQLGSLKDGAVGAGIPPYEIKEIITVVKAYSSAVGAGEFVSEIFGDEADELRRRGGDGGEFGATTGRPRRMGWLDLVATRYGCMVQGATQIAFTVLDVLGYLDEIPVCVGYELDGEVIDYFPSTTKLKRCKPVLKKLKGWKCSISGITEYDKLPKECREYIEFAEKYIGVPITMVSNGPSRSDIIYK